MTQGTEWPEWPPPGRASPPPGRASPPPGRASPPPPRRGSHSLTVAAVAIAAVVAGVVAAVLVIGVLSGSPSAPTGSAGPAPSGSPAQGAQGGGAAGGGPVTGGDGGGGGELFFGGKVTAISATSITLTAQGHTFTAAITSSTKFTGVSGPSGIKVGDEVAAQITGYDSAHPVVTGIQDPPAGFP